MQELFIQIRDGMPYQHPIFGENFRAAFPDVDTNNLPPEFARFVRTPPPLIDGFYRVAVESYVWDGDVVTDEWSLRDMTAEEKQEKIRLAKLNQPYPSWVFNEAICAFEPPIPYPDTTEPLVWDEPTLSWVQFKSEQQQP